MMRFTKMILGAVTVFSMLGASGVAMAVETCGSGAIVNQFVDDDVRINASCIIKDSVIMGDVKADLPGVGVGSDILIMDRNQVFGLIKVTGGSSIITGNLVVGADLKVKDAVSDSMVQGNRIKSGNIVISGGIAGPEGFVLIDNNTVSNGDIRCKGQYVLIHGTVDALATNNLVPRGKVTCFGQ